jgi:hypothetical protein
MDEVDSELKYKAGLGSYVKFYNVGNRQIQKGEYIFEHPVIWLKRINERAETIDCQLVIVNLNVFIGKINAETTIMCFNGWNKKRLGNHVRKVLGLKNGVFRIYTNGDNEDLRTIWYHGDFDQVTAIYQGGFVDGAGLNLISVESFNNLGLWQIRLRTMSNYNFVSAGVNLKPGQLIKIFKFMKCADYVTRKSYVIEETDNTVINQLKCMPGWDLVSRVSKRAQLFSGQGSLGKLGQA